MSKLSTLLVLPVLALIVSAASMDTYPKNYAVDMLNYAFHLTLSDDSDAIEGRAEITIEFREAGEEEIRLDLIGVSAESGGTGMTVSEAMVDGLSAAFEHRGDELFVRLPNASVPGQRNQLVVTYSGVAATGFRVGPNKHGDRTFFSDNWPNRARHWLPTVDHPYDKATNEFVVDAPSAYQVVSNGLLMEETDLGGGMRRTHWKNSVPIAPWLYVLGVAEFAVQRVGEFDGKELQTWVFPQDRDAGFYDYAGPTEHALRFYQDQIGPYAYEKLANIQASSVSGGMEAASAIFYSEGSVVGDRNVRWRNVIIHEIAHQWFGNAVTESDWDDIWLSEGFATYFTLLFREHAYGREDFVQGLVDARKRVWTFYQEHPQYRLVHDNLDDMSQVTTGQIYMRGAWVLHMLRNRMGDEAFWQGIRSYYADYFNANATTADFRRHMERASGQDLTAYFDQWLFQGGHVVLDGGWSWTGSSLDLSLEQVQEDGNDFSVPVEIAIYPAGGGARRIETLTSTSGVVARLSVPMDERPARVVVDPRTVLLAEWTFGERP